MSRNCIKCKYGASGRCHRTKAKDFPRLMYCQFFKLSKAFTIDDKLGLTEKEEAKLDARLQAARNSQESLSRQEVVGQSRQDVGAASDSNLHSPYKQLGRQKIIYTYKCGCRVTSSYINGRPHELDIRRTRNQRQQERCPSCIQKESRLGGPIHMGGIV